MSLNSSPKASELPTALRAATLASRCITATLMAPMASFASCTVTAQHALSAPTSLLASCSCTSQRACSVWLTAHCCLSVLSIMQRMRVWAELSVQCLPRPLRLLCHQILLQTVYLNERLDLVSQPALLGLQAVGHSTGRHGHGEALHTFLHPHQQPPSSGHLVRWSEISHALWLRASTTHARGLLQ